MAFKIRREFRYTETMVNGVQVSYCHYVGRGKIRNLYDSLNKPRAHVVVSRMNSKRAREAYRREHLIQCSACLSVTYVT